MRFFAASTSLFEPRETPSTRNFIAHRQPPMFIKYMGSKANIIDYVVQGLNQVYRGGGVCDLFAGSCVLSGAIGQAVPVYSNDIQSYSRVLAGVYLTAWHDEKLETGKELLDEARAIVEQHQSFIKGLSFQKTASLESFNKVEHKNRALIGKEFSHPFHLFLKNYSGTWWSAEQCLWIDALREIADRRKNQPHFDVILASIMHAMAYSSQGTGHYAQYRDANTESSMKDIATYRRRDMTAYFVRKYDATMAALPTHPPSFKHQITAMDYRERLRSLPKCTVYADPPYCFVHYSRFYHAMETLYLYDYPNLQVKGGKVVKGRYREVRHQSPFSIRTQVPSAFAQMFEGVAQTSSNLVLSYSNTGMITLNDLLELAQTTLGKRYETSFLMLDHKHMTMGRKSDRDRDVQECLILARVIK